MALVLGGMLLSLRWYRKVEFDCLDLLNNGSNVVCSMMNMKEMRCSSQERHCGMVTMVIRRKRQIFVSPERMHHCGTNARRN